MQYEIINRKFEKYFMPRVQKCLHSMVAGAMAHLHSGGYSAAINYVTMALSIPGLEREVSDLYRVVGSRHARMNYSRLMVRNEPRPEIKGFGQNDEWIAFINNYLRQFLTEKITFAVADTLRAHLLAVLQDGIREGNSIQGMVDKLTDWPFERFQAARIVRTEVNRAANVGIQAQAETSKYEQTKEWLSMEDNRVRGKKPGDHASHIAINGTRIDMADQFFDPRAGVYLDFPGDPTAPAATTVNCRCRIVTKVKRDADGEPILKKAPRRLVSVSYPDTGPVLPTVSIPRRPVSPRRIHIEMPSNKPQPITVTI